MTKEELTQITKLLQQLRETGGGNLHEATDFELLKIIIEGLIKNWKGE